MNTNGKTGQLLVQEGLARQEDIEAALEIQRKEATAVLSQDTMETDWLDGNAPVESLSTILPEFGLEESPGRTEPDDRWGGRTIGRILCDLDLITPLDLSQVLKKYRKQLRLGEILLRQRIVDASILEAALYEQQQRLQPVGDILVLKDQITRDQLYQALSEQYNIPYRKYVAHDLNEHDRQQLTEIVGFNFAEENLILPLDLAGSKLTLALCFPEKISGMQELSAVYAYLRMECVLVGPETFRKLFNALYGRFPQNIPATEFQVTYDTTKPSVGIPFPAHTATDVPNPHTDTVTTSDIINAMVKYAMAKDASSIHVEQGLQGSHVRLRAGGVLHPLELPWLQDALSQKREDVVRMIKEMAGLDFAESRLPQNGIFNLRYFMKNPGQWMDFDIRVSTCPVISGENVTLLISKGSPGSAPLDNLPHSSHVLSRFKKWLQIPAGIILVTGPPESGRVETLMAAVCHVQAPGIKVMTIEDTIRRSISGVVQTQIRPEAGLSYARLLRTAIHHDADVVMVENMGDKETVFAALDAVRAGQLIISKMDAPDAVGAIIRLGAMEIPPAQIAQSLKGVVSQRRIRRLCRFCRQPYVPNPKEWERFFNPYPARISFFREKGCKRCDHTGFDGHLYISEVLEMTPKIEDALQQGSDETRLRHAASEAGLKSILNDALARLSLTSLGEIIRVFPQQKIGGVIHDDLPATDRNEISLDRRHEWILASVSKDRHLVDDMWEKYLFIKAKNKETVISSEAESFRQYIEKSFHRICQIYHCDCVTFRMESDKGRVELSAIPGRPS